MLRFILKAKGDTSAEMKTVDAIVKNLEDELEHSYRGKYFVVGVENLGGCSICHQLNCKSDHK